ncbi:MAG: hypothetical protein KGS72_19255 [Cyanobacteria bacterium REEB67]|nr:hypothetical protein [Cyanobacteria bacterium REEB67]
MIRNDINGLAKGALSKAQTRKFVETHPASQNGLPRNIDRTMFGHGEASTLDDKTQGKVNSHRALSEQFLSGYGVERSARVMDWMENLKAESERFLFSRRDDLLEDELKATMYRTAISYLVDRMFQDLRWFAHEYNKVAHGTPLQISSSILGEVTEVVRMNSKREAEETSTFFRARLSNRRHSLIVRGGGNKIEFYIVPVAQALAGSVMETGYLSFATVLVKINEAGLNWRLLDSNYEPGSIDELCMWMFSEFVDTTRRELED